MSRKRGPPKRHGKGPTRFRHPHRPSSADVEALDIARATLAIQMVVARIPSVCRKTIQSVALSGVPYPALRNPFFARHLAPLERDVVDILRLLPPSLKTRALIARLSGGKPAPAHPMQSSIALHVLDSRRKSAGREAAYKLRQF